MNLFLADPSIHKLYSALVYGWRGGLKTGVYYTRTAVASHAKRVGVDPEVAKKIRDEAPVGAPSCPRDPALRADCLACSA